MGKASSLSPSSGQKQCAETLVTSAGNVALPCILDSLDVRFNHQQRLPKLCVRQMKLLANCTEGVSQNFASPPGCATWT